MIRTCHEIPKDRSDRPCYNALSREGYLRLLKGPKKGGTVNTLGLFRSILENEGLSLPEKLEIRDLTVSRFSKAFVFLQLKDPITYINLCCLGVPRSEMEGQQVWERLRFDQARLLKAKRIRHRNSGVYSRHLCGHGACPHGGMMVRSSGLWPAVMHMSLPGDTPRWEVRDRAKAVRRERRQRIIEIALGEAEDFREAADCRSAV